MSDMSTLLLEHNLINQFPKPLPFHLTDFAKTRLALFSLELACTV